MVWSEGFIPQILRLVAQMGADDANLVGFSLIHGARSGQAVFRLRADLLVDLDRYEVCRGNECLPLHAREADLLRMLLLHPRNYIKAEVLAEAIGSESAEEPEHPIEEMVSNIRQKLGEPPYHPRLLRCKRYAGYAIFPVEQAPEPSAAGLTDRLG